MNIETRVKLDRFKPRPYQVGLFDAIENKGIKKAVLNWHRRAGKDLCALHLVLRQALKRVGSYLYVLPTHRQARLTVWEAATNDGIRFLDFIPPELIKQKHISDMSITLYNDSIIYFLGSDNPDRLRGTNAIGIVFSEYAFQNDVYPILRPVLLANDGWCIFISTPNGMNHFYKLYEVAKHSKDWYCDVRTVEDTGIVSQEDIDKDVEEGLISRDMAEQEYRCSFTIGATGSYYSQYLNKMELNGQVGQVAWEPAFKVQTAWDLGVRDATCIIFFQLIGKSLHIIDTYSNHSKGLEHYVSVVLEKDYNYGKHFAPHDIAVREFSSGMSRLDKAKQLGIKFQFKTDHRNIRSSAVPNLSIMDGIEAVRSTLPKTWIDESRCKDLIRAIRDYRREYDTKLKVYKNRPRHDHHSHWCFTGDTEVLTDSGTRPIMSINDHDKVLTIEGWRECTKAYKIKTNAKLVEVIFEDNTKVRCTPEHLFLTESGWISARNLKNLSVIQSSLAKQPNSLMSRSIESHLQANITKCGQSISIGKYGSQPLGQFLTGTISTTRMATYLTTIFGTLNVYLSQIIREFLNLTTKGFLISAVRRLLSGTVQKKAGSGIVKLLGSPRTGKSGCGKRNGVSFAARCLNVWSGQDQLLESTATPTARQLRVVNVSELSETAEVYDIGVPGVGHFALANGSIVHNCDALRYLCLALPQCRPGTTPEDLERRYREAMGSQSHLPSVFRDDLPKY